MNRLKEKALIAIAWAVPASLAHWIAVRVVAHASCTRYRDVAMSDSGAADALGCWYDTKVRPR